MRSQLCFYLRTATLLIHVQPYSTYSYKQCLQALLKLQRVSSQMVSNFPTSLHHILTQTLVRSKSRSCYT